MNVFPILKRLEHYRVLRNVREQAQLELGVVRRNDLVSFFSDERAPDAAPQLGANGNVLQVGLAGRETAGGGNRLIEQTMNSPVSRNLMRQRVGVNALEFIQLAVVNNQPRQLKRLSQFFEHCLLVEIRPVEVLRPEVISSSDNTSPTCLGEPTLNSL